MRPPSGLVPSVVFRWNAYSLLFHLLLETGAQSPYSDTSPVGFIGHFLPVKYASILGPRRLDSRTIPDVSLPRSPGRGGGV